MASTLYFGGTVYILINFAVFVSVSKASLDASTSNQGALSEDYLQQNTVLEDKVKTLEEKVENLQKALHQNTQRDELIQAKIKELIKERESGQTSRLPKYPRQISSGDSVAFSAYLDRDQNLGTDTVVRFNHVILNTDGCYSTKYGAFTAPISGVYVFTFFIGQHGINEVLVKLVVNGVPMIHATAETVNSNDDSQGGNVVILKLSKNDVVKIEHAIRGFHVEGSRTTRLSTFSGFLLYSTDYDNSIIGK